MSVRTQRKRYGALARQIRNKNTPLTEEQLNYLANAFEKIEMGCDANFALGLAYMAGHKEADDIALEDNRLILHWMTCAMTLENDGGLGLSLEQAIEAVVALSEGEWINPNTKEHHIYKDRDGKNQGRFKKHTYEYIEKMWYLRANKPYKTTEVSQYDLGSPYPIKD